MTEQEKVVRVAESQVGVKEDPPGSNKTKYGEAYGYNGVPWCMQLVWWCFKEAGLSDLFYGGRKIASCTALMIWAANHGLFVAKDYQAGDVFLYDQDGNKADSEHTGIFTGNMDGDKYVVVEGNYSNAVCYVKRKASEIIGAYRPPWTGNEVAPNWDFSVEIHLPELSRGCVDDAECKSVAAMQTLLQGHGYWVGPDGCDGDFGPRTDSALRRYQTENALGADGVCGLRTWSALLGV